MKILKIIIIVFAIIIAAFLIIAALLPKQFHVEQSIEINKPVEFAFNEVNTLRNLENWSPFDDEDSEMKHLYKGPASGVGAESIWESEKQGNGSMIISESTPFEKIVTNLDFGEHGTAVGYFNFAIEDGKTIVLWGMDSETSYPVERVMFAVMKGMMEKTFQTGLQNLKDYCESISYEVDLPQIVITAHIIPEEKPLPDKISKMKENPHLHVLQLNERWIATIKDSCSMDKMEEIHGKDYGELMPYVMKYHEEDFGNPFTIWHSWNEETMFGAFEAGISIKNQSPEEGRIKVRRTKPIKVVAGIHYGPYDQTRYMYEAIEKYVKDHNMEEAGGPIELYVTDPSQEPDPNKWETVIMFQVK